MTYCVLPKTKQSKTKPEELEALKEKQTWIKEDPKTKEHFFEGAESLLASCWDMGHKG